MIATRWLIIFSIAVLVVIASSYLISSKIVTDVALRTRRQLAESDEKVADIIGELSKKANASAGIAELKKENEEIMQQIAASRSNPMEEKLVSQTENLIKVVEQGMGRSDGNTETVEFDEVRPRIAVTDVSPVNRARAKSVVSISRTINNPSLAARLIAPYMNDPNSRVRATAAAEMFKYDPVASENALGVMVKSEDKWMRLSAAWAVGEIADLSLMTLLEILIEDFEPLVKQRALASARKAAGVLKNKFPATLRVKIQRKI
jgi:polyhydroxyalkanoate synthesis regulator phasin